MKFPSANQRKALDEVKATIMFISEKIKTNMTKAQRQDWEYLIQKKRERLDELEQTIWNGYIFDTTSYCIEHTHRYALYGKMLCDLHPVHADESCICRKPKPCDSDTCDKCWGKIDEYAKIRQYEGI